MGRIRLTDPFGATGTASLVRSASQFVDQTVHKRLGVSEQHESVVKIVERVVDAGKAWAHAAFDDHHGAGLVYVEDRHTENGAGLVGARGRVGDIVGADDEGDISLREVTVD